MENLNAEQVKKALEFCANWDISTECKGCPYEDKCRDNDITKDSLALINSQEQRIGELSEENERLRVEGEWVHSNRGFDVRGDYECSLCHSPEGIKHFYRGEIHYKFCPNCGAKMKGEKNA